VQHYSSVELSTSNVLVTGILCLKFELAGWLVSTRSLRTTIAAAVSIVSTVDAFSVLSQLTTELRKRKGSL
jgi:hypothetical protein